jgi:hypothetical protein
MNNNKTIKSIGYNQHEILYNIMMLHNGGQPFDCDITYSKGNFYGTFKISDGECEITIPQPTHKFDVYPQLDDVQKIEPLGKLPLEDNSINSMVIDLPFVISTGPSMKDSKEGSNIISKRFSSYYPVSNLLESYYHWLSEASRVLKSDGILVFKCQNTITGSKFLETPFFSKLMAQSLGMDTLDEFVLLAKQRLISGKVKEQQHARSFHSYFFVFKKSMKKKVPYFQFLDENTLKMVVDNFISNNLKQNNKNKQLM